MSATPNSSGFETVDQDPARGDAQFVTLGIDREIFAVPVEGVLEILDLRDMFRVPDAPPYLAGLIDVRNRSVPVIDLRLKLGLPAAPPTESTRIMVLEIMVGDRKLVLGLVADRVFEVAPMDENRLEAPPDLGSRWRSDYIQGIGRREEKFVLIFDLGRLFASDAPAFLGAQPQPSAAQSAAA